MWTELGHITCRSRGSATLPQQKRRVRHLFELYRSFQLWISMTMNQVLEVIEVLTKL